MSAHTPGPWKADWIFVTDCPDNAKVRIHAAPKSDMYCETLVAEAAFSPTPSGYHVDSREEAEANALLIAAAPELLKAAQNAERLANIADEQAKCKAERIRLGCIESGDYGPFGIDTKSDSAALRWQELERERNALIDANRAAIAKAKGGAA